MSAIAKLVKSIGGETPPLLGQSATPLSQSNYKAQPSSATPSFNECSECPEEGWPAGPGRSLFIVSSTIARVVKSIGGETPPLPGQSAPPLSEHNHRAQSSSALPPSASIASARRRGGPAGPGRSLFTVSSAIAKVVKSIGGETPPLPGQSASPLSQRNHKA